MELKNHTKSNLEQGKLTLGLGLRLARTMDIGRILHTCGYDFAFIDLEHNSMNTDNAAQMAVACQDAGVTPLVRVPGYEHYLASRMLDAGAMGIVFPHVDSAEQARELVSYCQYPPLGHRSAAGNMAQLNYQKYPQQEASDLVNRALLIVIMLETPTAIDNADAIAAVPGVDVLLIGSNDLCMEMGIPSQFDSPKLAQAFEKMIAACQKHGKYAGLGGIYDDRIATSFIAKGVRFVLAGGDLSMLMQAASQRTAVLRQHA